MFFAISKVLSDIPESVGLLVFGIALIGFAVCMRWFLARIEEEPNFDDEAVKGLIEAVEVDPRAAESELGTVREK